MKRLAFRFLFALLCAATAIILVFPVYWAVNTALQPRESLFAVRYLPLPISFAYFADALGNAGFRAALVNSLITAGSATGLALVLGAPAACALGRIRFRGRNIVLYTILAMTMFPQISIVGALFRMIQGAHLYNKTAGLVPTYMLITMPFTVWVLTGFFRGLPRELEESAFMDGASPLQTFWLVLLPLARPGLVTTALLTFIAAWNEYLFALSFTFDSAARTVPVAIAQFSGETQHEIPWGSIMAASVLVTAPLLALALVFQRGIVAGLTAGAVKG